MKSLGLTLHEAASVMKREFERELRPDGLTLMQWRVLGLLADKAPLTQVSTCSELNASAMTISDLAERLEAAGMITRAPDPHDSRAKVMALTPAGEAQVASVRAVAKGVYDRALVGIPAEEAEVTLRTLTRIIENLDTAKSATKGTGR
ncbi:MarR family winged helix-turn-helix transcriptional regulator [Thioclava sp. A2]|uniref:MarR family winged helix-turn-helix transcriptional regulator n=1 Tax=Thioclava sp. FCG-A2 TaxID=3080562 RepID=UPI002955117F|nr:MarR family winged helix-turn-helix transcriptional regulator [Thioclava sp. A2]MDV7271016.1 MarR family winged helix-turn-helix transcriptional regulator [Thioclava sp. A2]